MGWREVGTERVLTELLFLFLHRLILKRQFYTIGEAERVVAGVTDLIRRRARGAQSARIKMAAECS